MHERMETLELLFPGYLAASLVAFPGYFMEKFLFGVPCISLTIVSAYSLLLILLYGCFGTSVTLPPPSSPVNVCLSSPPVIVNSYHPHRIPPRILCLIKSPQMSLHLSHYCIPCCVSCMSCCCLSCYCAHWCKPCCCMSCSCSSDPVKL